MFTCVGVGEVLLVDGLQLLVEEKEVGPEVLPGADLLPTSDPSDPQQVNLEKGLSTSEILKCEAPSNQWEEERERRKDRGGNDTLSCLSQLKLN